MMQAMRGRLRIDTLIDAHVWLRRWEKLKREPPRRCEGEAPIDYCDSRGALLALRCSQSKSKILVIYPPFEDALTMFYTNAFAGARPKRIKVGARELEEFAMWVDRLPGLRSLGPDKTSPGEYSGIPVECTGAKSYGPVVE